jgi:hypothetical protein
MLPITRMRLERNLAYHDSLVTFYQEQLGKDESGDPEDKQLAEQSDKDESGDPEDKQLADIQYLLKLHREVAKQLRDVLDAEPVFSAIETAVQNRPAVRNPSADIKPMAGRFTPRPRVFH